MTDNGRRVATVMVGAFYNPHLGRELAAAPGIDHLAMADPPVATDPWWPAIRERYTLLLHDYLGQLSEPLDERSIQRARALAELYGSPWVAEHFQCLHSEDGRYNLNYVFPPLYTEQFLDRFVRNANALQARLDQPLVMARADVAASVFRRHGRGLPARSAARVARGALPRHEPGALARRVPARARGGAARRRGSG